MSKAQESQRGLSFIGICGIIAAVIAVISSASLGVIVYEGVTGSVQTPVLAWVGMVGLPLALALVIFMLLSQAVRRVRS